ILLHMVGKRLQQSNPSGHGMENNLLYYACPIKAAYMVKYHGLKVYDYYDEEDNGEEDRSPFAAWHFIELFLDLEFPIKGLFISDSGDSHTEHGEDKY